MAGLQQALQNSTFNISFSNRTSASKNNATNWHNIFDQIIAVLAIALAVIGVVGNSLIIYKFGYVKRNRRSKYESLLLVLGAADLICVAVVPIVFAYGTYTSFQSWELGIVGCKLVLTMLPMNITITQGLLIFISYERYQAISKPLSMTSQRGFVTCVWIVTCVVIAIALASPYAYALDIVQNAEYSTKTCTSRGDRNDYVLAFTAINLIRDCFTVGILAITGHLTTRILLRNTRCAALENNTKQFKNARTASLMRVRRMLITMIMIFSSLTIPLDAFQLGLYIYFTFRDATAEGYLILRTINTALFLLQASNSAVNIFIYAKMHKDFKSMSSKISERVSRKRKNSLRISGCDFEKRDTDIQMISFSKIDTSQNSLCHE